MLSTAATATTTGEPGVAGERGGARTAARRAIACARGESEGASGVGGGSRSCGERVRGAAARSLLVVPRADGGAQPRAVGDVAHEHAALGELRRARLRGRGWRRRRAWCPRAARPRGRARRASRPGARRACVRARGRRSSRRPRAPGWRRARRRWSRRSATSRRSAARPRADRRRARRWARRGCA